jgi:hypothetical protein
MTDRLQKLREERELILRHLHWMDQEIAAMQTADALPGAFAAAKTPPPAANPPPAAASDRPADPTVPDPLEETHVRSLKSDVQKGCLLYFAIAWLVLLALVGGVYLVYR